MNGRSLKKEDSSFSYLPGFDFPYKSTANNNNSNGNTSNYRSLMTEYSDQESINSSKLNSMCLEATEIDYLRQIVYSYMMGVDPLVN